MRRLILATFLLAGQVTPPPQCIYVDLLGSDSVEARLYTYSLIPNACFPFPWDPRSETAEYPPWPDGIQEDEPWVGPALYYEYPVTPQSRLWTIVTEPYWR